MLLAASITNNRRERKKAYMPLLQGKTRWAKVTGNPQPGYDKTKREWSLDVYIDDSTAARLTKEGLVLKDKGEGPYLSFKRREFKQDGLPNQPIRIVDNQGVVLQDAKTTYTGPNIGNGTVVNIKYDTFEYAKSKFSPVILSMQIWDLVEYTNQEFPTMGDTSWEEDAA